MPDRVISVPQATQIAQRIKNKFDNVNERLTQQGEDITELQSGGYVADQQQIGAKINAWLNDHPEATTTVQDGSLTEAKFSNALKLKTIKEYVTPEMFGAVGNGTTDDTNAFLSAIAYSHQNYLPVLVGAKTYVVSQTLSLTSHVQLIGLSYRDSIIKFTGTGFCIEMAGANCVISNLALDAEYGIICGKSNSRIGVTFVEKVRVSNAIIGIKVAYDGGYNYFDKCRINTVDVENATAIDIGGESVDTVGTNYVYFNQCACEPVSGHVKIENTYGVVIHSGSHYWFSQCDFVGYDVGFYINENLGKEINSIYVNTTTFFDNATAVKATSRAHSINNAIFSDCKIYGDGYFLVTDPTPYYYVHFVFNNMSVRSATTPKGFLCNKLSYAVLDGFCIGFSENFARTFTDCTFAKFQNTYREIYLSDTSITMTVGNRMSLLPVKRKPIVFNYGTGTFAYTMADNGNGTVTITITATGLVNGCVTT